MPSGLLRTTVCSVTIKWRIHGSILQQKTDLSTDDVNKIAVSEQSVWVIPMIGLELNHYSKATGTWEVVEEEGHREIETIKSLGVDGPNVWFASGRGLTRYNEITREWKNFGPRDGLAGRGAEWITVDNDFIWVARSEWDRGKQPSAIPIR